MRPKWSEATSRRRPRRDRDRCLVGARSRSPCVGRDRCPIERLPVLPKPARRLHVFRPGVMRPGRPASDVWKTSDRRDASALRDDGRGAIVGPSFGKRAIVRADQANAAPDSSRWTADPPGLNGRRQRPAVVVGALPRRGRFVARARTMPPTVVRIRRGVVSPGWFGRPWAALTGATRCAGPGLPTEPWRSCDSSDSDPARAPESGCAAARRRR